MIERAIHEILADTGIADAVALSVLLTPERIVTGINHDRDLPYGSISVEGDLAEYRTNSRAMRSHRVRFQIWHDNHAAGAAIRDAVEKLFENKTFETTTESIKLTRHENSFAIQEPDGTWQFTIDLQTKSAQKG